MSEEYLQQSEEAKKEEQRQYWNYRYKNGMTRRHVMFCEKYLTNGHNVTAAAMAVGYGGSNATAASCAGWGLLKKPKIKWYINKRVKSVERKVQVGFEHKYEKLWQVAKLSTPDDAKTKEEIDGRTTVSAIAEMNKMSGDIAPEKRMNFNVNTDADIQRVKELQQKLLEKHTNEY